MGDVALAQTVQPFDRPSGAPATAPGPTAPGEPEVVRGERALGSGGAPTVPLEGPLDPDTYTCGRGDVFELNFWGAQNFRQLVTVDLEGNAFVSKVGYVVVKGKTLTVAKRLLREAVAKSFPKLNLNVTLAEPRTFVVHLVENVAHPGSYPARQIDRVSTILDRAGGLISGASRRQIEIRRHDGTTVRADLLLYTLTGDLRHNPFLLDGDVVRVPFEGLTASVGGAVRRPGRYELTGSRDLVELVDLAGGPSATAARLLPISVTRWSKDDGQDRQLFEFTPDGSVPPTPIRPEDSVRIPSLTDLQQSVTVIGAIAGAAPSALTAAGGAAPGVTTPDESSATRRLPFVQGDSVRTLLERVGGIGPLADLARSYILRQGKTLPVDLDALLMLSDLKADRAIELGDTLVVPFKRRNILVEGAVFAPGSYAYNPSFGIDEYLSLAGGRNRSAQPLSDVRLVTPNGVTKQYGPDLKVEPGSSLVVPERNFSRSEIVQMVIGAASFVLSGIALVLVARK
jgi:polysaccharide biosynthesis/export protein